MQDLISERLGTVALDPTGPVVAGTVGEWRLLYSVGSYGIDEGGTIKLSQRFPSDWQVPQFDRPDEPAYTSVSTDGAAKLRIYYSRKAHERPWWNCIVMDVYDGCLAPGDTVTIILGDQSQGSPGIRAQTFQESAHEFRLLVDPTNSCVLRPLPSSPCFPVVPDAPVDLICLVPSQSLIGEPVEAFVRGVDRWGNPVPVSGDVALAWQGTGDVRLEGRQLTFDLPGSGFLLAKADGLAGRSNPITAYDEQPRFSRFWGDLHAQSEATVGTGTEEEYFTFARDQARLDFCSHQGNDFQVTDTDWERLNQTAKRHNQDGQFVVFPGYEWSGNTSAGGDHNVIYRREGLPILRSSHWQIPSTPEDALTPAHPADVLFERLRRKVGPENVMVAAHVGGRYADVGHYFDQAVCRLVELVSCWGVFEWLLWDALEQGHIVGVTCNSDGHKGRPGAEGPGLGEFGIGNGLTCVLARELTRESVFEALRERRCYGTTGPRIDLSFEMDGWSMGTVLSWREKTRVGASAVGTAPLESLSLYQGRELIQEVRPAACQALDGSRRVRVSWGRRPHARPGAPGNLGWAYPARGGTTEGGGGICL